MSSDESFSSLMNMRFTKKSSSSPSLLKTPVVNKREVASKLTLSRQFNFEKENTDPFQTPPNTASKQKVSASFLFSSCKKKQMEGISSRLLDNTVLVANSSDEEYFDCDSIEKDANSAQENDEVVEDSLVEYSLIRKWLQNAEDSFSSADESDPENDNSSDNQIADDLKPCIVHRLKTVSHEEFQKEVVVISSDSDEDIPSKKLVSQKRISLGKCNFSFQQPLEQGVCEPELAQESDNGMCDSFDNLFDTKSLQQKLAMQEKPSTSNLNKKDVISSSGSEVSGNVLKPFKKSSQVLCISSDDETFSPVYSLISKKQHGTSSKKVPATISESESELEDIFVSLTINDKPPVKPKKPMKPRQRKKEKAPSVPVPLDSKNSDSFLASLSTSVPQECRHPDAAPYVKSFKKHRDELTYRLFKLFNEKVFNNYFQPDFSITWNARLTRTAGYCRHFTKRENGLTIFESRIELSVKVVDTPCRLRDTLIHELCHAATWVIDNCRGGHGPMWRKWANEALYKFPELPPITRCHNYEISYKFYYNCVNCAFSAGRHSKSIDTTTHVCPMCRGQLKLSKEPPSRLSEAIEPSTTKVKTPRTPNAFALFVKDNYASVKSSRADLPHAAVMKLLSAKFAESKKQLI